MTDYIIEPQPMVSGFSVATSNKYTFAVGRSGRTWLIADTPNPADHIYVSDPRSQGFGGATLTFELINGERISLKGPWHSNSESLYSDTGIDVREQHLTFVVVSKRRVYHNGITTMCDVLYQDERPTVGAFKRGESIARAFADELGVPVICYSQSDGGSSIGPVSPTGWTQEQEREYWRTYANTYSP